MRMGGTGWRLGYVPTHQPIRPIARWVSCAAADPVLAIELRKLLLRDPARFAIWNKYLFRRLHKENNKDEFAPLVERDALCLSMAAYGLDVFCLLF